MNPLNQDDAFVEEFNWKFKPRTPYGGWRNFFTQYGISKITSEDFWNLVGDLECIPIDDTYGVGEETSTYPGDKVNDYTVTYRKDDTGSHGVPNTHRVVSNVDFDSLNRRKKTSVLRGNCLY